MPSAIMPSAIMQARRCALILTMLGVWLAMSPAAWAQRSFGSRTSSLVSLATYEAVQKDLGIGSEAAGKLETLGDEYRNASQKEFTSLGIDYTAISDLPALERAVEMRKASEKSGDVTRKLTAVFLPKLEQILSSEQIERLKQIQLQAAGIDVWSEPLWAKQLDLSEVQKAQLAELRNEFNRKTQALDGDFNQRIAKTRELNSQRDGKALDLLSEAQKAKLTELKGQPFDVTQLGFRRRGNN